MTRKGGADLLKPGGILSRMIVEIPPQLAFDVCPDVGLPAFGGYSQISGHLTGAFDRHGTVDFDTSVGGGINEWQQPRAETKTCRGHDPEQYLE